MILPRRISLANCLAGNTTGIQLRQRRHELAAAEAIGMTTDKGTMNALYLRDLAHAVLRPPAFEQAAFDLSPGGARVSFDMVYPGP